ncbi:PREDICTED: solute carrier family 35 member F2-like [Camelina sativa]|uniref:Solute carrier family 35 member F2-like n=1 Tax=Camelina sativa TaxID=90675 RepID=A0ABM0WNV6_CAMSA|nr:PREDICTED: solute carrier family 35 member F2-like [Camelina sativa]
MVMGANFKEIRTKKTFIGLGLGQLLSLLSTSNGFTSSELARKGINVPTSQTFLNYVLLAVIYGGIMLYRRPEIKVKWYYYFLALVDVEANFLVVKAYQYTSLTSVMLLDCWAIPCVLVLTWVFLKTKYRLMKISGVVICIVGVVMVVFSDVHAGDRAGGSNPIKGDFLVIAGATLYAVSNATEEETQLMVKAYQYTSLTSVMLLDCWAIPCVLVLTWVFLKTKYRLMKISGVVICIVGVVMVVFSDVHAGDRAGGSNPIKGDFLVIAGATLYAVRGDTVELMTFMGFFGAIISAIQISIFERSELTAIHWSTGAVYPFLRFALTAFLFYSLVPVLLKTNGSTMFNLSLLTADMWSVLIRIFAYHEKVDWLYFLTFATTAIGLIIYSIKEKDLEEHNRSGEAIDEEAEWKKLVDEDGDPGS